ncbi:MAG: DUF5050 domain-containing protein [Bacilli bacterium]|nr:DUF5050 domain-containing protein [Bacilli bacterium]
MKAYRLALLSCASIFALISCGPNGKKDFTGIEFNDTQVDFDGKEHTIAPKGVPSFAHYDYVGESHFTSVGEYPISIKVTADGYNDYAKTATLTIKEGSLDKIITFEDDEVTYDGNKHTIEATGIPEGAEYNYSIPSANYREKTPPTFVDAGEYYIALEVNAAGYKRYYKAVKLTISPGQISGVTFESKTVAYDGNPHKIEVKDESGIDKLNITYSPGNTFTEVGEYKIKATIEKRNYETLELEATLTIENSEVKRNIYRCGDTLYFQNVKDHNRLYAIRDDSNGIVKVSNDNAIDIVSTGNGVDIDEVAYIDNSSLLPAIKYAKYDNGKFEALNELSRDCRYLQTDGACYYYAVNSPVKDQSGIYKLSLADDEADETCLYQGNAYFLQLVDDNIYFASGADKVLSYINKDREGQEAIHIQNGGKDVKIKNLSHLDGALYYTGEDGIYQYTIASSSFNELVDAVGVDFSLVNNDLYYVAADESLIYGSSIHKVDITSGDDSEVIATTSATLSSLTSDGTYLYYYDDEQLIRCDLDGKNPDDLLADFDPQPVELTTKYFGQVSIYNDIVYYIDAYDDGALHSYNPTNQRNTRLTSNKVANYSFVGDTLYASTIYHSPNDNVTYAFDLNLGSATLLCNVDAREIVSDGTYLYYAKNHPATNIYRCALDGSNPEALLPSGGSNIRNLRIAGNGLYFISSNTMNTIDLTDIGKGVKEIKPDGERATVSCFDIGNGYIYYCDVLEDAPRGAITKCPLGSIEPQSEIIVHSTQALTIKYHKNDDEVASIYYYVNTNEFRGLYYVSVDGPTYEPTILQDLDTYHAQVFDVSDTSLCFSDYATSGGDMHVYYSGSPMGDDPICIDW